MKFEDSPLWNHPLVAQTRSSVSFSSADLNAVPAAKVLLAADALDPVTASSLIAAAGNIRGKIEPCIADVVSLLQSPKLHADGPDYLFKAEDTAALKIIMGTLIAETTGEGFKRTQAIATRADVQRGIDMMAQIAELLVETGAHNAIEPKLVEKFIEGLENMKPLAGHSPRRKMVNEAGAGLKYALMQGNAADIAYHAPRIDPASNHAALKHIARGKPGL